MALSNWDMLALDDDGRPGAGSLITPTGVEVVIYRNWLYVHDAASWQPGMGFSEPTVACIHEGNLRYHDLSIAAVRGPQEGIYVLVTYGSRYWGEGKPFGAMAGCGVEGYGEDQHIKEFPGHAGEMRISAPDEVGFHYECGAKYEYPPYVGVLPESRDFLRRHVDTYADMLIDGHALLSQQPWQEARRYCQGDVFFAANAGFDMQSSLPGQAGEPAMSILTETLRAHEEGLED